MRKGAIILAAVLGLLCVGAVEGRSLAAVAKPWPALDNCVQTAKGTQFYLSPGNKTYPATTYCFSVYTAAPANNQSACGKATVLDRIQLKAKYALRANFSTSIRDTEGERKVKGSWHKNTKLNTQDEYLFSLLQWTPEYISTNKPRICLTLNAGLSLNDLCLSTDGKCTFGLYSVSGSSKCCPVYSLPIAA